ncbi:hypothetical protein [Spiroplasma turonicum]|uniref:Holliday junction DNA helicase RuvA n=1 Tax=Spiroplasma turonicum TaxID=216946 RepID=A0A0K1P782_9MOLU|nr:hypothetical protein [Spiroplasma turonicum]AKU79752.1 Holliday junction DNA helicase RuvA [Spiroplasma turonicum]ALX70770.1 Holliday junction DNA helicase RuvA [Spiroplasma turonicum]
MYLLGKIVNIEENEITIESNNNGYIGKFISDRAYKINEELKVWYLFYKNEYYIKYLFFDDFKLWKLSTFIIDISNVGFKTLEKIYKNINYDNLIKYSLNYDIESIVNKTRVNSVVIRKIIEKVRKELLSVKFSNKQLTIINSLYNLGYNLSSIYSAISEIDFKQKDEIIVLEAINKLNEVKQ